jgi:hypothetical protein
MTISRGMLRVLLCLVLIAMGLSSVAGCEGGDSSPKVSWSSPGDGGEVFGIARLKVKASSGEGISEVKFYCDSIDAAHLIGTVDTSSDSLYTQLWYTTGVQNGEHVLYSLALDAKQKSSQASITVNVGNRTRLEAIPAGAEKWTPQKDDHPPVLSAAFSAYWYDPVPMEGPTNTAGAEDSPFVPTGRQEFYFFFTPDPTIDASKQLLDEVSGIWVSRWQGGQWQEPERVWLEENGKLALDGCTFVSDDQMLFCSAREGYTGIHWFSAELEDGKWQNWQNADFPSDLDVGELHILGDELYYGSSRAGGKGSNDIWMSKRVNGVWQAPTNIAAVNTADSEMMPFLTADGQELWFNRTYMGTPAVYRSKKVNGQWQTPELIVSQFAGEPTLDWEGNLYFVHHYYEDGKMIEADIYVCRRK